MDNKQPEKIKNDGDAFLSVGEVAGLLKVHPNTVRRWSNLGILRPFRIGLRGHRKFWAEHIKSFLEPK